MKIQMNETLLEFIERTILHKNKKLLFESFENERFNFIELSYVISNRFNKNDKR